MTFEEALGLAEFPRMRLDRRVAKRKVVGLARTDVRATTHYSCEPVGDKSNINVSHLPGGLVRRIE